MLEKSTYYVLDASGNQISMYEHEVDQQAVNYTLTERNIYGSSRLGRNSHRVDLYTADLENPVNSVLGEKYYELSNHLGNVLAVLTILNILWLLGLLLIILRWRWFLLVIIHRLGCSWMVGRRKVQNTGMGIAEWKKTMK